MGKKKSGGGGKKTVKAAPVRSKGPKPDYKIPKIPKDVFKELIPTSMETARLQMIAAPKKDKWMYKAAYKAFVEEKCNGGLMIFKHNSNKR
jgi:hypothetical protein